MSDMLDSYSTVRQNKYVFYIYTEIDELQNNGINSSDIV